MSTISIRNAFAGRHVLITGASGFVGKVWLAMALERLESIGRIYVLLRGKEGQSAIERFERFVGTSPAFRPLHDRLGTRAASTLAKKIEVVEGDITLPNLDLDAEVAKRLQRDLDLVINSAGLVDFNPDLRKAFSINTNGLMQVASFTASCSHAALMHISTCYVRGNADGKAPEEIRATIAPNGQPFGVEAELAGVASAIWRVATEHSGPAAEQALHAWVRSYMEVHRLDADDSELFDALVNKHRGRRIKAAMAAEGTMRARRWGWPNTYTYTKAMAEAILATRYPGLRYTVFRPAIVESALTYPMPGWNEGFNTSAPLVYLARSWFRTLPAKYYHAFDVIPVDQVCNGMFTAAAALMENRHAPVYQCGSSSLNLLSMGRSVDLTALAWRRELRCRPSRLDRLLWSRFDFITGRRDHPLATFRLRRATQRARWLLRRSVERLPKALATKLYPAIQWTDSTVKKLRRIERILQVYEPFCYDNDTTFETRNLVEMQPEEPAFRFAPQEINWRDYWLNVHVPGLMRWCFPRFEGRPTEKLDLKTPFKMPRPKAASAKRPLACERTQ